MLSADRGGGTDAGPAAGQGIREVWVPHCSLEGNGLGASPDARSRRGFLPPPDHSLGPWPSPRNQPCFRQGQG